MNTKVSVITVCYNACDSIEQTMQSVLCQTYDNMEYLIIDGQSTDGTTDIIRRYANRLSYWHSEPDNGIFDAMNKGLNRATGDWVLFMNAGDSLYDKNTIECVFSNVHDDKIMLYGDTLYVRTSGQKIEKAFEPVYILRNMPTCHQSFFIRTDAARSIGFDTRYQYAADYNMVYQLYKQYGKQHTVHLPLPVSIYEACTGLSMQHENEVYHETLRIRSFSLDVCFGYFKYYVKKILGRP